MVNGPKISKTFILIFSEFVSKFTLFAVFLCPCVPVFLPAVSIILPISGTNPTPELWAKMLSVIRVAGFLNQIYSQNKWIKWSGFCMLIISLGGHGQKWLWSLWSKDSKIGCISRMNWWNKRTFWVLLQIQKS